VIMEGSKPAYGEGVAWRPERPAFHPLRLLVAWLIAALALLAAAAIVPGVHIEGFWAALAVAAVVALLNAVLPPLVAALRLPFMLVLGFVLVLVVDALIL
jgi:putative membrane protein